MEYAEIEPFGEYQADVRHGQMMHLLDRAHFKRDAPLVPADFMNFRPPVEPEAPDETPEMRSARILQEIFGK